MSLAGLEPLNTYKVIDPILDVSDKDYFFFQGGQTVDFTVEQATSSSNNLTQFNVFPPDIHTFVDRRIYIRMPVNLQFQGTAPQGQNLLQSQYDAFRSFPLNSVMQNLQLLINDVSTNLEISEYLDPLMRYHNKELLREHEYSLTPCQNDLSQTYEELEGSNRNPLASKLDVPDGAISPRGNFTYYNLINENDNASLDAVLTEPLFISPLVWGNCSTKGLYNVRQMKITCTWSNNLQRIWSHSNAGGSIINNITVTFGNPELLFRYVQPFIDMKIPKEIDYNYFNIVPHVTNVGVVNSGVSVDRTTRNLQLTSIPKRMYIYVRRTDSEKTFLTTESYAEIQNIRVQFGNKAGILSNASQEQLYLISRKNGCQLSFTDWKGEGSYLLSGSENKKITGVGSIVCLQFGHDIPLEQDEAAGINYNNNFRVQVRFKNIHPTDNINFDIYLLAIEEGVFSMSASYAQYYIGVITRQDVLNSPYSNRVNYEQIRNVGYGDFFGDVGRFFKNKAIPAIQKGVKVVKQDLLPIAKEIAPIVMKLLGGEMSGGLAVGGQMIDRSQLKQRMELLDM